MPHLLHHDNNDNNHQPGENRVKKILSHVNVSSILPQRISFHKSASEKSAPSTARSSSSSASSASVSSESKEVIHADGFQEPKRILFPKAKVQALLAWQSTPGAGAGLNNHGNTCFLNSVVQCISYTPPLANYLLSREHSRSCKTVGFCMMCILEKHVTRALSNSGSISPSEIVQNLRKIAPGFRPGRQEDAHEFLRFVVENAQKSCLGPLLKDKSITPREAQTTLIGNIFGGYLQSQVKCSECNYESNTYDPFMDLSVDLGDKVDTLNAALTKFIKPEILDAKNMYMCSKCKKRVRAQKRMRIYQAPPILTIQLKRFSFFQMFGGKINRPIKFDAKLNLDPYMVKPCPEGSNVYNLYGVLVHLGGSTNSGHYYSFIKAPNGDWYQMDDQSVSKVSLGLVLQQKAYILFYARSPSPTGRSTTPTKTAPSPSPSLSSSFVSVSSTPVSPSSSSHLNGQRRDPNSKTSGADPKDKANGKPTLPMSNLQQRSLYQQQQKQQQQEQQEQQQQQQVTATTNTTTSTINSIKSPSPQRRILQQQQQQQQQDTHLQEKQSTTTTILPRALRIQQQQQLKQQLKLQQQQQQQKQQNESLPSPSEENTAILLSHPSQLNGTSHNDKRKRKNEETLLGEKKKRKIDHSILAINCIFSVRDIEPQNDDSEKVDKIEKKAQKQKTQKEQKTSEEIKQVKSDSVITPTPTETSAEKKEKKKAAKKAKKAERKKAKQAEKAKEADKVKATEKTKDTDIWRNFFDEAANTQNNDVVMNGKHSENEKMNGKTENGKMNGKHENGKVNGKHENGKVNGKHENGKMNGKHENGKTENGHMNGKTENGKVNGKTENGKMNGKGHSIDMWKRKEREEEAKETETKEKEEKEVTKNGKHSKGAFGAPKFTVSDGIPVTQAKEMAQNFLKTMELVRDNSNVFGTTVESWDSEDAVAAAEIRKKKNNDKQAKVDRMFQDRDEWDIEYDMGKQKKVKTYDLFDNNHNLFQSLADHRANTKN